MFHGETYDRWKYMDVDFDSKFVVPKAADYVCSKSTASERLAPEEASISIYPNSVTVRDVDTKQYPITNRMIRPHAVQFAAGNFDYDTNTLTAYVAGKEKLGLGQYDCKPATTEEAAHMLELRADGIHYRDEPPLNTLPTENFVCGDENGKVTDAWVSIQPQYRSVTIKLANLDTKQYQITSYMMSRKDDGWHFMGLNLNGSQTWNLAPRPDDKPGYLLFVDKIYMGGYCRPAKPGEMEVTIPPPPPPKSVPSTFAIERAAAAAPPPPPGFCNALRIGLPMVMQTLGNPVAVRIARMKCGLPQ
jgi:hypothetical protein